MFCTVVRQVLNSLEMIKQTVLDRRTERNERGSHSVSTRFVSTRDPVYDEGFGLRRRKRGLGIVSDLEPRFGLHRIRRRPYSLQTFWIVKNPHQ